MNNQRISSRRFLTYFAVVLLFSSMFLAGCNPLAIRFLSRAFQQTVLPTDSVTVFVGNPIRPKVGLSALWIGHSSMLIQIGNKVFLTDPMFQRTLGMIISRITEPGLAPAQLTRVDYTLISHIHLDHLNYGSLDMLPRDGTLVISRSAIQYIPEIGFAKLQMLSWWESFEIDGVKITAIPAKHFGGRYGMDNGWSEEPTFCGYVIEYDGTTVLFAGDTGYHPEYFKEIGRRFKIDLALIPIGPIEPRDFMKRVHTDPAEALQIFDDVGARWMIPIHYKTFSQGLENDPMLAQRLLEKLVVDRGLAQQVAILKIGEQRVFKE